MQHMLASVSRHTLSRPWIFLQILLIGRADLQTTTVMALWDYGFDIVQNLGLTRALAGFELNGCGSYHLRVQQTPHLGNNVLVFNVTSMTCFN